MSKQQNLVSQKVPSFIKNMEGQARGSEEVTADDIQIPRVEIIQSLSPQKVKGDPKYIEGAVEGILFNTITNKLYGESIQFCPSKFVKEYLIYRDRKMGGGFRGSYKSLPEAREAIQTLEDGQQCEIKEVAQHYGVIVGDDGSMEEVCISMASTKLKVSRKFNSLAKIAGGDRFSRVYKFEVVSDKNDKGMFYNYRVEMVGYPSEEVYRVAENLYDLVSSGKASADREEGRNLADEEM